MFNGRTWVRVEKYIHENSLEFCLFYTLLFLFMCVPTCDMHVELKDNLGEFLLSSTVEVIRFCGKCPFLLSHLNGPE